MNLYLRKDGRFESRIPNGKRSDGKRAFLYVLARTKEQCIERVQAIKQRNHPQGICDLTMTDLFSEWHRSIIHRVKESTAANYIMKANKHILPAFGDLPVGEITADCIYSFISEKQQAGFAPRYIADMVVLMKSVFKYAVR
ncbi:MAG: site-specific integrase, partial [Lachnospiraceae bacterium]|nr:site-specific integrase [Lachnospiraceae bacterium]